MATLGAFASGGAATESPLSKARRRVEKMKVLCAPHLRPHQGLAAGLVDSLCSTHDGAIEALALAEKAYLELRRADADGHFARIKILGETAKGLAAEAVTAQRKQAGARPRCEFALLDLKELRERTPLESESDACEKAIARAQASCSEGDYTAALRTLEAAHESYEAAAKLADSNAAKAREAALARPGGREIQARGETALARLADVGTRERHTVVQKELKAALVEPGRLERVVAACEAEVVDLAAELAACETRTGALTKRVGLALLGSGYSAELAGVQKDIARVELLVGAREYAAARAALGPAEQRASLAEAASVAAAAAWDVKVAAATHAWVDKARSHAALSYLATGVQKLVDTTPALHGYDEASLELLKIGAQFEKSAEVWKARHAEAFTEEVKKQEVAVAQALAAVATVLADFHLRAPGSEHEPGFQPEVSALHKAFEDAVRRALTNAELQVAGAAATAGITAVAARIGAIPPGEVAALAAKLKFKEALAVAQRQFAAAREGVQQLRADGHAEATALETTLGEAEAKLPVLGALPLTQPAWATLEARLAPLVVAATGVAASVTEVERNAGQRLVETRARILTRVQAMEERCLKCAEDALGGDFVLLFRRVHAEANEIVDLAESAREDVAIEALASVSALEDELTRLEGQLAESKKERPTGPMAEVRASLLALAGEVNHRDLVAYLPERAAQRREEHTALLADLATRAPEERRAPIAELRKRLAEDLKEAGERNTQVGHVAEMAGKVRKQIAELGKIGVRIPAFQKQALAQVAGIEGSSKRAGWGDAAMVGLASLTERLTELSKDPVRLAEAEGQAHVAADAAEAEKEAFDVRWTLFDERRHAIKEIVRGAGGSDPNVSMKAVKSMGLEAKNLAKGGRVAEAQRMLASAMELAESFREAPLGQAMLARDQLKATQQRWKDAVTAFNGSVTKIVGALNGKREARAPANPDLDAAIAEFEALRTIFSPAAFERPIRVLENPASDPRACRAQREAAIKTLRRYERLLLQDPSLLAVRVTPFGKTPQKGLLAAINDLNLNIQRAL